MAADFNCISARFLAKKFARHFKLSSWSLDFIYVGSLSKLTAMSTSTYLFHHNVLDIKKKNPKKAGSSPRFLHNHFKMCNYR